MDMAHGGLEPSMADEPQRPRRGRRKLDKPHPTDVHVGARVRLRRTLLGMSQEKLGEALGLTFQQVQKYERGANRIGASRLFELAHVLDVPVGFFFEDMPPGDAAMAGQLPGAAAAEAAEIAAAPPLDSDLMLKRETLELVRAYYRIADPQVRRRLFDLTKTLAKMPEAE
jgi:transcriptional regulator with XRE-family HTH domain